MARAKRKAAKQSKPAARKPKKQPKQPAAKNKPAAKKPKRKPAAKRKPAKAAPRRRAAKPARPSKKARGPLTQADLVAMVSDDPRLEDLRVAIAKQYATDDAQQVAAVDLVEADPIDLGWELPRAAPPSPPKRRTTKPPATPTAKLPLRGRALVEQVIAKIEAEGGTLAGCGIPEHPAKGLAAAEIARLTLPGGRPLPPSLRRFLAYDETFLGVLEGEPPHLAFRTFREMLLHEFDERTADIHDASTILPGMCLVIPGGSDSRRFMYVGEPDEHGEYPVMVVDTDDTPYICIAYPGLDVYLADGVVTTVLSGAYTDGFNGPYGPALIDQARRNFYGFKSLDYADDTEHVDGEAAGQAMMAKLADEERG